MKLRIKILYLRFKQSKFLLAVIMGIIGFTACYIWLEAPKVFEPYKIAMDFNRRALAYENQDGDSRESNRIEASEIKSTEEVLPKVDGISVEELIKKTFGADADSMLKIAQCESQLQPSRVGDSRLKFWKDGKEYGESIGVFQIRLLPGRPEREQLFDPEFNVEYAKQVFERQGYGAWYLCATKNNLI